MSPPKKTSVASVRFSVDEDEKLIDYVKTHASLYDLKDAEFKNSCRKEQLWTEAGRMLNKSGTDCRRRWKSMRDHYKREKKGEKTAEATAAKKKRAVYWDRLQFLDGVDDERSSFFSNVPAAVIEDLSAPAWAVGKHVAEHREDALSEAASSNSSHHGATTIELAQDTPLPKGRDTFRRIASETRQEKLPLQICLRERKEDRKHLKRCLEDIAKTPMPRESDNEIDLFFKAMAATVKKFRPDLATQTKMSVFKVVTDMELLNQQTAGFANMIGNSTLHSGSSSPSQSPHSVHSENASATENTYVAIP